MTNLLTVHLTSWEDDYLPHVLPTILGSQTQWCFDDEIITPVTRTGQIALPMVQQELMLGRNVDALAIESLSMAVNVRRSVIVPPMNATTGHGIDIDMYFPLMSSLSREIAAERGNISGISSPTPKDRIRAAEEVTYSNKKEEIKKLSVPGRRCGLDLSLEGEGVRMRPTFDYPGCPACGWQTRTVRESTL